jgi:hypothetical protein
MHPYSIDTTERRNVLLILASLSILLAWLAHKTLSCLKIILPWWLDSPSVLFFYGFLFSIFNKFCWKWKFFRSIGLTRTPDLNGDWVGVLRSSFDNHSSEVEATLKISQTWTHIKILLSTKHSLSYSKTASIITNEPAGVLISYQYINKPKVGAPDTMHIHYGTANLLLDEHLDALEGEYYSGRDRKNFGSLELKRIKK